MLNFLESPQLCQLTILFLRQAFSPMKRYPRELLLKSRKQSLFRPPISHALSLSLSLSLLLSPLGFYFVFPFRCFSLSRSLRFVRRPLCREILFLTLGLPPKQFNQSLSPSCFVRLLSVSPAACGFSFICTRTCGETPPALVARPPLDKRKFE